MRNHKFQFQISSAALNNGVIYKDTLAPEEKAVVEEGAILAKGVEGEVGGEHPCLSPLKVVFDHRMSLAHCVIFQVHINLVILEGASTANHNGLVVHLTKNFPINL